MPRKFRMVKTHLKTHISSSIHIEAQQWGNSAIEQQAKEQRASVKAGMTCGRLASKTHEGEGSP